MNGYNVHCAYGYDLMWIAKDGIDINSNDVMYQYIYVATNDSILDRLGHEPGVITIPGDPYPSI